MKHLKLLFIAILLPFAIYAGSGTNKSEENLEPQQQTLNHDADVIVCGGGPAGVAAAISSSRHGAKTILIEMQGCLGGVWTTGLLSNILDYRNKKGIMTELVERLQKNDAQYSAKVYDAELMKLVLDQMCEEAGVSVRLYTRVVGAKVDPLKKIDHIITESTSGKEFWKAKVYIDATGNGDLAAQAGCGFDYGHPENGKTQPMSLMAIITGLNEDMLVAEGLMEEKGSTSEASKQKLYQEIKRAGILASYTMPTMFAIRPGLIALMANHQYGVSALKADDMTRATIDARSELNAIVDGLRSLGGVWKNLRMVSTAGHIGIREGRRIHGLYTLTADDLIRGVRFKDAVCRPTFNVDIHALDEKDAKGWDNHGVKSQPYDIPLRSLIAKDVKGLMMAGRCISGDFFAHASYRVTGNSVVIGEAAGEVAARAALKNCLPQEIEYISQIID